jgi:hypothetical protein
MTESIGSRDGAFRAVRVLAIAANVQYTIRFLGPYEGLLTHWVRGRSVPCEGPNTCPIAIHRCRTVWKGYAPIEQWDQVTECWWPAVLEITEALEELLRGRKLRGEVWLVGRPQEGRRPAPVCGVLHERCQESALPPPFDVTPVLLRFYHCSTLVLGVINPIPSRVVLPASVGQPPTFSAALEPTRPETAGPEQMLRFKERLRKMGFCKAESKPRHTQGRSTNQNGAIEH